MRRGAQARTGSEPHGRSNLGGNDAYANTTRKKAPLSDESLRSGAIRCAVVGYRRSQHTGLLRTMHGLSDRGLRAHKSLTFCRPGQTRRSACHGRSCRTRSKASISCKPRRFEQLKFRVSAGVPVLDFRQKRVHFLVRCWKPGRGSQRARSGQKQAKQRNSTGHILGREDALDVLLVHGLPRFTHKKRHNERIRSNGHSLEVPNPLCACLVGVL